MKLTGELIAAIHQAILAAYPTRDDLRIMVRIGLDENLDAIADGANQRIVIFNLLTWAERAGCIDDLLKGAHLQNPGNPVLAELMRTWQPAQPPATDEPKSTLTEGASTGPTSIDLFLSYSRKDNEAMHQVQEPLRAAGLNVWTDEWLAPGTQSWKDAIAEAVEQAHAMVVLLSPNSARSTWVKNEISFAQAHTKRIFPVLIAGNAATSVPIDLINAQWVDGRENLPQVVAERLLPDLRRFFHHDVPQVTPGSDAIEREAAETTTPSSPEPSVAKKSTPAHTSSRPLLLFVVAAALIVGAVGLYLAERTLPASTSTSQVRRDVLGTVAAGTTRHSAREANSETAATASVTLVTEMNRSVAATTLAAISLPTPTPASGTTWTNPKDGAVYVYVPAGPFIMGSSDNDLDAYPFEKPQQSDLYLDAFWIMQAQVTNAQYANCVTAGTCSEPGNARWSSQEYAQHPVAGVDWYQANAYAQWVGGRLPTEAEWEKACRGSDGRVYPWGNDPASGDSANFNQNVGDTTLVGSYPNGASPYGVLDMAGNVWEWTSTKYSVYPYKPTDGREDMTGDAYRVLRGGSWLSDTRYVRCANRYGLFPDSMFDSNGFRVLSPVATATTFDAVTPTPTATPTKIPLVTVAPGSTTK